MRLCRKHDFRCRLIQISEKVILPIVLIFLYFAFEKVYGFVIDFAWCSQLRNGGLKTVRRIYNKP